MERRSGGGGASAVLAVLFIGMLIAGLVGYKTNYGKIEALSKQAVAESDKLRELLSRRPGAKVNEKFLQPVTWDAEVLKKFNEHIAGIQREFTRIDTMPAKVIDAAPAQPKIGGG